METKIIRTATKNKTNFINNLIEKLNTNAISKLHYLKALANKIQATKAYGNTIQQT